ALCVLGVRLTAGKVGDPEIRDAVIAAFQPIEDNAVRRSARDFVDSLYRYHIALNRLSGNRYVEFFYSRPYMRFFTTLLSELAPGDHWDQYLINYRLIHETILTGDAHSAVVTFSSHIRWVLRNMREALAADEA
ncbi:MAG: FCD domain-containing protein, partial [Alphaproteobacteria bacterium]